MTGRLGKQWLCCACGVRVNRRARFCAQHKPNGPQPKPVDERLWAKVSRTEGCWLWTGATDRKGYGKIGVGSAKDGTRCLAIVPRVAWEVTYGPIPDGLHVLHRCDNPPCCRPDHLFLGTCADNHADMLAKGRANVCRKLSVQQIEEARALVQTMSLAAIGRKFGVDGGVIRRAVRVVT